MKFKNFGTKKQILEKKVRKKQILKKTNGEKKILEKNKFWKIIQIMEKNTNFGKKIFGK